MAIPVSFYRASYRSTSIAGVQGVDRMHGLFVFLCIFGVNLCFVSATTEYTLVVSRRFDPRRKSDSSIVVNGTSPGPTLYATVGDTVVVTVINDLKDEATMMHWHGLIQKSTPWADGSLLLTQCPISNLPGSNVFVYSFVPQSAGTFWYHGHYHSQYPDGLYGALVVTEDAPTKELLAERAVDIDEDRTDMVLQLFDLYGDSSKAVMENFLGPGSFGLDPIPDALIVNDNYTDELIIPSIDRRRTQRLRLINAAAHSYLDISIDGLPLLLIELDGVLVDPILLSSIRLFSGQRASVVLDWNEWKATAAQARDLCGVFLRVDIIPFVYPQYNTSLPNFGLIGTVGQKPLNLHWKGLLQFTDYDSEQQGCGKLADNDLWRAVSAFDAPRPVWEYNDPDIVTSKDFNLLEAVPMQHPHPPTEVDYGISMQTQFYLEEGQGDGIVRAYINEGTYASVEMEDASSPHQTQQLPRLYQIVDGTAPESWTTSRILPTTADDDDNFIPLIAGDGATPFVLPHGAVIDIMVDGACCGVHPFHLHGHHFWIIATSERPNYLAENNGRALRRDVVTVPFGGWMWLRMVADNPGVWLFHCHLHWHFAMGLAAVFVEAPEVLNQWTVPAAHRDMCTLPPPSTLSPSTSPAMVIRQPHSSEQDDNLQVPSDSPSDQPAAAQLPPVESGTNDDVSETPIPSLSPSTSPSLPLDDVLTLLQVRWNITVHWSIDLAALSRSPSTYLRFAQTQQLIDALTRIALHLIAALDTLALLQHELLTLTQSQSQSGTQTLSASLHSQCMTITHPIASDDFPLAPQLLDNHHADALSLTASSALQWQLQLQILDTLSMSDHVVSDDHDAMHKRHEAASETVFVVQQGIRDLAKSLLITSDTDIPDTQNNPDSSDSDDKELRQLLTTLWPYVDFHLANISYTTQTQTQIQTSQAQIAQIEGQSVSVPVSALGGLSLHSVHATAQDDISSHHVHSLTVSMTIAMAVAVILVLGIWVRCLGGIHVKGVAVQLRELQMQQLQQLHGDVEDLHDHDHDVDDDRDVIRSQHISPLERNLPALHLQGPHPPALPPALLTGSTGVVVADSLLSALDDDDSGHSIPQDVICAASTSL